MSLGVGMAGAKATSKLLLLTSFLLISILFGADCTTSAGGCPNLTKFIASTDPEHSSWKELYNLFIKYKGCDDGIYAEGYSDFVTRSLAKHWDRFDELAKLSATDKAFEDFVLRHIDATADWDDISLLLSNAQEKCPASSSRLCYALIEAARAAMKEIENFDRRPSQRKEGY
jgi:hypothetical protein